VTLRRPYLTDLSDAEFACLDPLLPPPKRVLRHWRGSGGTGRIPVRSALCCRVLQCLAQSSDDRGDVARANVAASAGARRPDRRHPHEVALERGGQAGHLNDERLVCWFSESHEHGATQASQVLATAIAPELLRHSYQPVSDTTPIGHELHGPPFGLNASALSTQAGSWSQLAPPTLCFTPHANPPTMAQRLGVGFRWPQQYRPWSKRWC
jgi:hypothetical protein